MSKNQPKNCIIEGCNRLHEAKGYCSKHYYRFKKYGNPLFVQRHRDGLRQRYFREYTIYHNMKRRCSAKATEKDKKTYYDKGVKVCDRWLGIDGFQHFIEDMGKCPEGCSLDRINPYKGYSKDNCRWTNTIIQARNKRTIKKKYSPHLGVTKRKGNRKPIGRRKIKEYWLATVVKDGKRYCKYTDSEIEAIQAWEDLNQQLWGNEWNPSVN